MSNDSDSGDTDFLLRIPPNFYSIPMEEEMHFAASEISDISLGTCVSVSNGYPYPRRFSYSTPKAAPVPAHFPSTMPHEYKCSSWMDKQEHKLTSLPIDLGNISLEERCAAISSDRNLELKSLGDLWKNEASAGVAGRATSLQEERLRREHCEFVIQALQSKLLEYQQKMSVAIEVDKTKLAVIMKKEDENSRLRSELKQAEERCSSLEKYNSDLKWQRERMEKDMEQAENLTIKYEAKNKMLVTELDQTSHENQREKAAVDDLKIRLAAVQQNCDSASEKLQKSLNDVERLKESNRVLNEKFRKETERSEQLQKQNGELNLVLLEYRAKDKEKEKQKQELKKHYQVELEKAVTKKLLEFQCELDKVEERLKTQAKDRERLIAERALKQLDLMNQNNQKEILLLQEKCKEEVELARLQLTNAMKKIQYLEGKLKEYKANRAEIVEKLHGVMESQWQKAVELLISPNSSLVHEAEQQTKPENESFQSPSTSRSQKTVHEEKIRDRLQAYVDLLLSKSPTDIQKLEEASAADEAKRAKTSSERSMNQYKSPWR